MASNANSFTLSAITMASGATSPSQNIAYNAYLIAPSASAMNSPIAAISSFYVMQNTVQSPYCALPYTVNPSVMTYNMGTDIGTNKSYTVSVTQCDGRAYTIT